MALGHRPYGFSPGVFGGIAVILAGDFGQLPPVAISPPFSLLHPYAVRGARER